MFNLVLEICLYVSFKNYKEKDMKLVPVYTNNKTDIKNYIIRKVCIIVLKVLRIYSELEQLALRVWLLYWII